MSFLMQLLAWVACVVVGTALFIAVVSLNDFRYRWDWPRLSSLRCPECGSKYDLRIIRVTFLPLEGSKTGPGEWEVKCASCGLQVVYLRRGKIQRTFRQP
ncbi:hypothetical protein [Hyalangium rubrum]|uniref:Zinc-ribbon 15 domain-containing protein n=1 Tax=Hyalangium rubrum TaxID=3103134 RepID=A0ABU5HGG9_9BACT|nr:hypothetical protein [Hyalangium sp. s54d21]MDY7232239.1 hypothetical protein [Hyalangium sp. s54d21]